MFFIAFAFLLSLSSTTTTTTAITAEVLPPLSITEKRLKSLYSLYVGSKVLLTLNNGTIVQGKITKVTRNIELDSEEVIAFNDIQSMVEI